MSLVRSADHRYRLDDGCRVSGCTGRSDAPGTARGYCVRHYARWYKNGLCEAADGCADPAVNHLGLCDRHTPRGLPR